MNHGHDKLRLALLGSGIIACMAACAGMSQSRRDVVRVLGEPDVVQAVAGDLGVYLAPHEPLPKGWKVHTVVLYYLDVRIEVSISADGTIEKSPIDSESEQSLRESARNAGGH